MTTKHTPTPWRMDYQPEEHLWKITDGWDFIGQALHKPNAAHIVHCVNTHDEMLAALKNCVRLIQETRPSSEIANILRLAGLGEIQKLIARAEGKESSQGAGKQGEI